ncbi:MAG: membrane protein insertase YidC [Gammaproteobacteria bacterium]|nr:membrane protein insertase YidC [Gammaproteobacteria bacterium]
MDNLRLVLWATLALTIWMSFQAWQKNFAPASSQPVSEVTENVGQAESNAVVMTDELPVLPDAPESETTNNQIVEVPVSVNRFIRVKTDVLDVKINLEGGDLQSAALPKYPLKKDEPDNPVRLLSPQRGNFFVFRTGVRAIGADAEPNHLATYMAEKDEYILPDGQDELFVTLRWSDQSGVKSEKIYRFTRGSYAIGYDQVIDNQSSEPYQTISYTQLKRLYKPVERSMFDVDTYSFVGPVIFDGSKYEKYEATDLEEEPVSLDVNDGWIASIQHHFLVAAVPDSGIKKYEATYNGGDTLLSIVDSESVITAPGDTFVYESTLFVGPKLQAQLEQISDRLTLTVDYGLLTILAQPLFWLLKTVYQFLGNWGWTIIIVTMLIKLAFYKLTEKSGRSMAKMRKLAPRLKSLQERYKDDREALSRSMMDLYKTEKVNPAAGCWPMLVQIPFFIAFYWVLLESVEMRQAPFMLWITDLSIRDPFFILPLLMGAAMFFQQKLNPAPPDPMQAKVMQFLPIVFTAMFAFFPAGLVLYWLTNSVLSMAQQWRINKMIGAD